MTDADGVRTFHGYNSLGEHTTTALRLASAGDDIVDTQDRITVTETTPGNHSGFDALTTTTKIFATANSDEPTIASTSAATPDGLRSWSSSVGSTSQSLSGSADGAGTVTAVNWALSSLGSVATQSSNLSDATKAPLAIDGNTDGTVANGAVSCTQDLPNSWWQVDLGRDRPINEIILFNRSTEQDYLSNFKVEVLAADGTTVVAASNFHTAGTNVKASETWTLTSAATGRIVKVSLLGENNAGNGYLSLAEVQVNQFVTVGANTIAWSLAGATATQSTTDGAAVASRAIDGNTDGDPAHNSVSATQDQSPSWWVADLNQALPVNRVVLHNRTDGNGNYLSNFKVTVYCGAAQPVTKEFYTTSGFAPAEETWTLTNMVHATKIRVELLGQNRANNYILSLAEVRLLFDPTTEESAPLVRSEYTITPDGTIRSSVSVGGQPVHVENRSSAGDLLSFVQYGYDSLRRMNRLTDSRTGLTATQYVSDICDAVASVTDPGSRTTSFTYDHRGNRLTTVHPTIAPTPAPVTHNRYNSKGQLEATWGSLAYATVYSYDYAGRLLTLGTEPTLDASDEPVNGTGNVTVWNHDPDTGLLLSKLDPDDQGPTYTYTPAGRLKSRLWARESYTRYDYGVGGQLDAVRYFETKTAGLANNATNPGDDPATPDVIHIRDRLGRPETITQTNQSQLAYAYASDLGVDTETIRYDLDHNGSYDFARVLDRADRSLGRNTGFTLGTVGTPNSEQTVSYGYHATTGRLSTVSNDTDTFTYGYVDDSNLLSTTTKNGDGNFQVTRTYEDTRDVLDTIENKIDGTVKSKYDYTVNAIGQRTNLTTSGDAFGTTFPTWEWRYDAIGQLEKADTNVADKDRSYQYDDIGNRITSADGNWNTGMTAHTATASAAYFGAVAAGVPSQPGANSLNQYAAITRGSTTVEPLYDYDGNMKLGPLPATPAVNSTLVWDAENRLVEALDAAGTDSLVKYTYDALSRRIATVTDPDGTPATTLYVYDGWNCVAEYNINESSEYTIQKSNLWGLDLSGSMQGAGGVGGLLSTTHVPYVAAFYPTYDGNGNVSEYYYIGENVDVIMAEHYEYDPFGNIVQFDSYDEDWDPFFTYRFSTKPLDYTTGLYYYGYRWYDPLTGRWPSRDPIGERGGLNLYGFVGNDGVARVDPKGQNVASHIWEAILEGLLGLKHKYNEVTTGAEVSEKAKELTESYFEPLADTLDDLDPTPGPPDPSPEPNSLDFADCEYSCELMTKGKIGPLKICLYGKCTLVKKTGGWGNVACPRKLPGTYTSVAPEHEKDCPYCDDPDVISRTYDPREPFKVDPGGPFEYSDW